MHHNDLMVLARELNREPHGSHAMSIVLEELADWLTGYDRLVRSVVEKERRISELETDREALQRECQQFRAQDCIQSAQKCIVCMNPADLTKVKIHVMDSDHLDSALSDTRELARMPISTAAEAATAILPAFPKHLLGEQECFCVLHLGGRHGVLGTALVAMGTSTSVEVQPRDVFREAIRRNATAVIVAHNHPAGDLLPSWQDRELTRRLVAAGRLLGVAVLDHLVIAPDGAHVSLAAAAPELFETTP